MAKDKARWPVPGARVKQERSVLLKAAPQTSKKPKQKLKEISIGDMISDRSFVRKSSGAIQTHHQRTAEPRKPADNYSQIFPSLTSSTSEAPKVPHAAAPTRSAVPVAARTPAPAPVKKHLDTTKFTWGRPGASKPASNAAAPSILKREAVSSSPNNPKLQQNPISAANGSAVATMGIKIKPSPAWPVKTNKVDEAPVKTKSANVTKKETTKKPQITAKKATSKKQKPAKSAAKKIEPSNEPKKVSVMDFFKPKKPDAERRIEDDDAHQLLRMMQNKDMNKKKGRQQINKRKKKFSSLKKKVLEERLRKWKDLHPEEYKSNVKQQDNSDELNRSNQLRRGESCSVCLYGFTDVEDVEDDDEYEEILSNLQDMASKVGKYESIYVPRELLGLPKDMLPVFVRYKTIDEAEAAVSCWNGIVVGGLPLSVSFVNVASSLEDTSYEAWCEAVVESESKRLEAISKTSGSRNQIRVIVKNIVTDDDYDDEDCMAETVHDIRNVAEQFGTILECRPSDKKDGNIIVVYETDAVSALSIVDSLCTVPSAGSLIDACLDDDPDGAPSSGIRVMLNEILTTDDLQDEDCLAETMDDVRQLAACYGAVGDMQVQKQSIVLVYNEEIDVVENAVAALGQIQLGGAQIDAKIVSSLTTAMADCWVDVTNLLTEDDLTDADCLEESLADFRKLASKYGTVIGLESDISQEPPLVKVQFEGPSSVASQAAENLNGLVLGGQMLSATVDGLDKPSAQPMESSAIKRPSVEHTSEKDPKKAKTEPMYSGDKLIPERFAECKRVPKIPNSTQLREYANIIKDDRVRPLLSEMLGELMRLQKRALEENNTKAKRRLVMGLREVARGIRSHKVKMVVMANNLDEYGALDEKLQEIVNLAKAEDVPLFFEFTKRSLGKAIGKSIKIAVVGIQNADGAHQPFKKLVAIAAKL